MSSNVLIVVTAEKCGHCKMMLSNNKYDAVKWTWTPSRWKEILANSVKIIHIHINEMSSKSLSGNDIGYIEEIISSGNIITLKKYSRDNNQTKIETTLYQYEPGKNSDMNGWKLIPTTKITSPETFDNWVQRNIPKGLKHYLGLYPIWLGTTLDEYNKGIRSDTLLAAAYRIKTKTFDVNEGSITKTVRGIEISRDTQEPNTPENEVKYGRNQAEFASKIPSLIQSVQVVNQQAVSAPVNQNVVVEIPTIGCRDKIRFKPLTATYPH